MEEIFGGEGMSIKNPYPVTYRSSMSIENNPKRDIFNEGVKAANEDWIEWVEKNIAITCVPDDCEFYGNCGSDFGSKYCKFWQSRKKEINQ